MKVIHIVLGKANPNRMNGVNKVAHQHATHLSSLGTDVELWGITHNEKHNYPERNYKTRLYKAQRFPFKIDVKLSSELRGLKSSEHRVHIHGALIPAFYTVARKLAASKIPFVYTPHGAFNRIALEKNAFQKKIYLNLFERWILKHAKRVHFLGKSEAEHIDSLIRLNNKVVIPNGQDMDDLTFEYSQLVKRKQPVFGFCGRMDMYYKGLDMLLEAFFEYKRKNGQGALWLIGDGEDQSYLYEQVCKSDMHEHVTFYGKKFGEEKLNIIANMDAFVHPSRSEGSPTAVLEAAGLGIPCLISTATNMGEIIESNGAGIHIKENNPLKISEALFKAEQMFFAGELKPMGARASQLVKSEFNWSVIARKLMEIY